jgi:hypothetical protein
MPPPAIRRRGAEDLISGLPDELLHTILVRLKSAAAAARTSVLSRRWRGVWAHMPELVLRGSRARATATPNPSALLDSIDAALNFYAAPTLHSLKIDVTGIDWCDVPANRIAPWLRFASQRLAGKLCISLCVFVMPWGIKIKEQLALPIFERATEIDIKLPVIFFLRPPPTGSFSALTDLKISCARMDGGELGCVVSSPQCPRLRKLRIFAVTLDPNCDVCICSESVECLDYRADNTGMLEVNAPKLQEISVSRAAKAACIVAPNLENIKWSDRFDPSLHQFDVVKRHLNSLSIMHYRFVVVLISSTRLMERYDTVKELTISLRLHQVIVYVQFFTIN